MQIEPFKLKNLDAGTMVTSKTGNAFLPGGRKRGEVPPPRPSLFSEEQLKAAERESYKKGFLEGTAEGRKLQDSEQATNERRLMETLEGFVNKVTPLFNDYQAAIVQMKQDMPKTALSIAHKVASKALQENAPTVVEETVLKCVQIMLGEPQLIITVHPSMVETLKSKVESLAARAQSATAISVNGDAALPQTDCRVEWKHGAMMRDTAKIWQDITHAVDNMAASAKHDAETQVKTVQAEVSAAAETTKKE